MFVLQSTVPVSRIVDAAVFLEGGVMLLVRGHVRAGLRTDRPADQAAAPKATKPKKRGRKPLDDNDVILAADVISSDDDYDDAMNTYQYAGQAVLFRQGTGEDTPAASDGFVEASRAESVSESEDDDENDDDDDDDFEDDFVG